MLKFAIFLVVGFILFSFIGSQPLVAIRCAIPMTQKIRKSGDNIDYRAIYARITALILIDSGIIVAAVCLVNHFSGRNALIGLLLGYIICLCMLFGRCGESADNMNDYFHVYAKYLDPAREKDADIGKLLLAICCAVLAGASFYFYQDSISYKNAYHDKALEVAKAEIMGVTLEAEKDSIEKQMQSMKEELEFLHSKIAYVTESGEKYHRWGCCHTYGRTIEPFPTSYLVEEGFEPCRDCNP